MSWGYFFWGYRLFFTRNVHFRSDMRPLRWAIWRLNPALRRHCITTLKTKDAVNALEGIPPSLASKARQYLGGIVNSAIREGLREDGRLLSLRGALRTPRATHIPAATSPADIRRVALAVHAHVVPVTRIALQIAMLTAQRPGEVVSMEWKELDLENAEWRN